MIQRKKLDFSIIPLLSFLIIIVTSLFSGSINFPLIAFTAFAWSAFLIFFQRKNYLILNWCSFLYFLMCILADSLTYKSNLITYHNYYSLNQSGALVISNTLITYIYLSIFFWLLFAILCQTTKLKYLRFIKYLIIPFLISLFFLIPSIYLFYWLIFGTHITPDIFHIFLHTNYGESYDFLTSFGLIKWIIVFLGIVSLSSYLLIKQEKKQKEKMPLHQNL